VLTDHQTEIRHCGGLGQRRSIQFADRDAVAARLHTVFCADVECSRCGTAARFFCGQSFAYVGTLPARGQPPLSRAPAARELPPYLQALVVEAGALRRTGTQHDLPIEDSDFDIMFSNAVRRTIGSVKDILGRSDERPLPGDSPSASRSYLA
jgi:hypothetical protein